MTVQTKSLRQGNTNSGNSLQTILYIAGTKPSPINPLTDTVPHRVILQYENVHMITKYTTYY